AREPDLYAMRDFLVDYVNEHYLHPNQEEHQTGHAPFSTGTVKALRHAWQIAGDVDAHPLARAAEALRKADQGVLSEETQRVALVPAQGPLRIFSGDLGDACYTSQHGMLAKGEVPNLHAMAFVTG